MKTIEKVIILVLFIAICSMSFGQDLSKSLKDVTKEAADKVEQESTQVLDKASQKYLNSLDPKMKEEVMDKLKSMSPEEKSEYIAKMRTEAGDYIDGVQRGKPGKDRGTGEVDGVQRGKPNSEELSRSKDQAGKVKPGVPFTVGKGDKHKGHDHGSHEGHDHGSHEGHDHGSHEGHNHGKGHARKAAATRTEAISNSKDRIKQAKERHVSNGHKMEQVRKRLDSKLANGEISKEDYDAKAARLDAMSKRMKEIEERNKKQVEKLKAID